MSPPSSGSQHKPARNQSSACYPLHAGFLLSLFSDPEDGGYMFLRNVLGKFKRKNTKIFATNPR
jgi:hypothetical protein